MTFLEKKDATGYTYEVDDVFGKMELSVPEKLDAAALDSIFLAVFNLNVKGDLEGNIEGTSVKYKFFKKPQWTQNKKSKDSTN